MTTSLTPYKVPEWDPSSKPTEWVWRARQAEQDAATWPSPENLARAQRHWMRAAVGVVRLLAASPTPQR